MISKSLVVLAMVLALCASVLAKVGDPTGDLIARPVQGTSNACGPMVLSRTVALHLMGDRVRKHLAGSDLFIIRPERGRDWRQFQRELQSTGLFEFVVPDTVAAPCSLPNDPGFSDQWHLTQISATHAWDFNTGLDSNTSQPVVVASIDGGVDLTHPDLSTNLVPGYNTLTGLAQALGGDVSDIRSNGHGTRIAGVIAAKGNNGIGVCGVGWNLKVMPIRCTDDAAQGLTTRSELLEGAQWAISNGARVVTVSYSEVQYPDVEAMGQSAWAQGSHLVWAAGNTNSNWSTFDFPHVIIVGGTDQSDNRWVSTSLVGSSYGRAVDIFAPCILIRTTSKGGGYGYAPVGTSFAAPQVAASLALLEARYPDWPSSQIEWRLLRASRDLGTPGADTTFGWGRLNAGRAVNFPDTHYDLVILPKIFSWAHTEEAQSISDSGRVIAKVTNGSAMSISWYENGLYSAAIDFTGHQGGFPGNDFTITDSNSLGTVTGTIHGPGLDSGFIYKVGSGWVNNPNPTGWPSDSVEALTDLDIVAGFDWTPTGGPLIRGWSGPIGSPATVLINTNFYLQDLNESGQYVGSYGWTYTIPFVFDGQQNVVLPKNVLFSSLPEVISRRGEVYGNESSIDPHWLPVFFQPPYDVATYQSIGPMDSALSSANDNGVAVGRDTLTNRAMSFEPFLNGGTYIDQKLNAPLPPQIVKLETARDINNSGEIVGGARGFDGKLYPYLARPTDGPVALIDLGQLGATPTYIGSIPPSLNVTFTDSQGAPYPNSNVQLQYAGNSGRVHIALPASVTGQFRLYLECDSSSVPGYDGPRYLPMLYPPLGTPAAGPDIAFIPFSGAPDPISGLPILEMFTGDVDASNEIDAADIDVVIENFGMVDGQPGFNRQVDVDGSGEIDAVDIDIVIENFGLVGDPEP